MKARPPEYWGSKDEDPDTWIRRIERVFDANEWTEDRTKVSRAKVALKGLAERWATANDHLLTPGTCTWEEFKRLFRTRFRPSDFEQKLRKDIFTVRQCTGETVRAYAERYQTAIALLASETEPLDGLLNIHRKQWTHGLHADMRRHVMVANPPTFAACLELALNAEEAEGGTETAVIHALNDTLPPIFQEREAVENLTKGLAELQLLAKAKERGNTSSGNAGFERQMTTAPRGRGGSWNGPQRTNFRGRPVEGRRDGPMRRPRFRRPIEDRRCYECGMLGHLSYDCPKLQVQGKFANVTRNSQPSYIELKKNSVDESDEEEFSERGYEKDEYEVEVQAFMARGQGGRQERAEAREVRRRREEEAAPAQPSTPVRPSVERAAPPRQTRRKPVLEAQWQKYVRESWTIPIGMLAGRSRREVYGQAMLALRDALGRQQTRAQMATETGVIGGYLGPYRLKKALIDPGSTRTLVSEEFVNRYAIPMQMGSHIRIELANGQIETPVGELLEPQNIEIAGISTTLDLPVVRSRGVYDLLLGRNWLRALEGSGEYGARTTYRISGNGKTVVLRNTRDGCIPVQIETDEEWATTSSGSTHTSDYTWTEKTDDHSSEEDSVSSEGSAYSAKYTEDDEESRTGPMLHRNIPAFHALRSSDSDEEIDDKGSQQKGTKKLVRAHLLNEATLEELNFGVELTKDQLSRVKQMLMSHSQCFALSLNDVGRTTIIEHHIRLKPGARPVYRPGFKRFSQPELQFIESEIQKQLTAGIIREEDGPWCAPVTLGMKKNGKYRFCVAYIGLNAQTERESWPLPNIEEVLDNLGGFEYYTTLDGFSGFNTIPIEEDDQHLTTFRTPWGTFCYTVMPFGLKNAPHTYCRYMHKVFAHLLTKSVKTYLDDVAIASHTFEQHMRDVDQALDAAEAGDMRVNPQKGYYFQKGAEFLGHWVSKGGVTVMPNKVEKVQKLERPSDVKGVRSFLGLTGYYRRFIPEYAHRSQPLTMLTRKNIKWQWSKEQEDAFEGLKTALSEAPVLRPPQWGKPWIIDCDASNTAVGAVLSQEEPDTKEEHPVYYYSRLLNSAERNYSTTDRECLAVIAAVKKFRVYVLGAPLEIRTDHTAVRQLLNKVDATGRYARWVCIMSEFDFTLRYRPGPKHGNADGLSRAKMKEDTMSCGINDEIECAFRAEVEEDPHYRSIVEYLRTGEVHLPEANERRRLRTMAKKYTLQNDELYYRDTDGELKLCLAQSEVPAVLTEFHESSFGGHWGRDVTISNLRRHFYWPTMRKDVIEHLKRCEACQQWSKWPKSNELRPTWVVEPFDLLYLDWIIDLPMTSSRKSCIITCTDALTKWTETRATVRATALESTKFLAEQVIFRFGVPVAVATDNGTHFMGEFDTFLKAMNITHHWGTPYHPQSTGQAERTNALLINRLRPWFTEGSKFEWDHYLQAATLAINSRQSPRLLCSPMQALFGRKPKVPTEVNALRLAIQNIAARYAKVEEMQPEEHRDRLRLLGSIRDDAIRITQEINRRMVERYNRRIKPYVFKKGDRVWMRSRIDRAKGKKLLHRWSGPGTITWIGEWGAAEVEDIYGGTKMYNLDDLKPYFD